MKKLIVKSQLDDELAFEAKLKAIGRELSPVIWQHERIYLPHDYKPEQNYPRMVARTEVRATDQPAAYALYLKRHIEDSGVDYIYYTGVSDYQEAVGIIHQLGFKKAAEVSRQRRELWLDKRTVIYLDKVERLAGAFLKIEIELLDGEAVESLRLDLFRILEMLGQKTFLMQAYFDLLKNETEEFLVP